MTSLTRRSLFLGGAVLLAAPSIVRVSSLMKVKPLYHPRIGTPFGFMRGPFTTFDYGTDGVLEWYEVMQTREDYVNELIGDGFRRS